MEPISTILAIAVIAKMISTHREEMEYARHGQVSPRSKMKLAEMRRAGKEGAPPRPGARGYVKDLWNDCWEDLGEHRRRVRQERKDGTRPTRRQRAKAIVAWARKPLRKKAEQPVAGPVDDMVDHVGVRAAADVPPPVDPWANEPTVEIKPEPVRAVTDDRPDAKILQFPNIKEIKNMSGAETRGLGAAIAFANAAAEAYASYAQNACEVYMAALRNAKVGDNCIALAAQAAESSGVAAAKWKAHAESLVAQTTVTEAYRAVPDAGDKEFVTEV